MVTFRRQYKVARPVYSEDSFAEHYERTCRQRKTTLDHIREYLTWDSKRTKNAVLSLLPIIGWLRIYKVKEWLLGDVVSGISTGLVAIMQGLAFSLLASLPPSYGLYTAFFPMLTYFFLGTSRHISVGSFPVLSLMVGAVVTRLVPLDETQANVTNIPGFEGLTLDQKRVLVASSMTFLVGIFQLAMGILQFGFIVVYLSDTLVSGFTTAAAVHILVSQLKFVLGLDVPGISGPLSIIYTLEKVFVQITSTNLCDLVMSIIIMVVVFIVKELNDRYKAKLPVPIPIEVIVTIIACGVSYGFNFNKIYNVDIVGEMVRGYEAPVAPNLEVLRESALEAFPTAIVGFAVAFSVAKVYSKKHDYIIDGNQELIAFGVSNIFGATFKSFAASTALSRTAVQESSGGKTQVAGLISAMMAMIVTLALGFLLEPLPRSVLGALVIVNLKGMLMQFREIPYLWRKDTPDCVVWVATCLSACLLGLDLGLAVGLGVELLTVIFRTQFPRCCLLANIQGTNLYRDRKDYTHIFEPKGVKIFKIPSPLFFANIEFFKEKLREAVGFNPLKILKKRNKALRKVRNLAKKSNYDITENGLWDLISTNDECSKATEELDELSNVEVIPSKWNLPASISFPRVDLHSLILDFSTVSFVDISAVKGLKLVLKEFLHIDVDVYIVSCDVYVLEKLHNCMFFDTEIQTSVFFPTLHDAVLHVLDKKNLDQRPNRLSMSTKL
ncbi:chloride anion exchanger-like [Takifugu rubripes]|uniref:chloride anion exchanger-like n=1 Tax=Takifugu rubripes TaxID=31033 RepID=UPI0002988E8D|nr:chloride anion exchanger-like [Takifugu rubripes]XP_029681512.1 chloride anion exchanger-like [Takifugu rubripes]|eukprot:XP_003978569.1 PREDICTED: chloride anion exchanger-like [Takifugu rubripes]